MSCVIKSRIVLTLALSLTVVCATSVLTDAAGPKDTLRSGTDRALELLETREPGEALRVEEHREEIFGIVNGYFSFEEMARRALGGSWDNQTQAEREDFVGLFRELLLSAYVSRLESYTGSGEEVIYEGEEIEGDHALVRTRVSHQATEPVPIQYHFYLKDGDWQVFDVVIEGVSLLEGYRKQFDSLLEKESFHELLERLRKKVESRKAAG